MADRSEVDDILKHVVSEEFIKLWWTLKIPGLGMQTPNEVWERDPAAVLDYANGYLDPSFS